MKRRRYSEEQVTGALKQMESGRKARDLARELGVFSRRTAKWGLSQGRGLSAIDGSITLIVILLIVQMW